VGCESASVADNGEVEVSGPDEGDATCVVGTAEATPLVGGGTPTASTAALGVAVGRVGVLSMMGLAVETDAAASAKVERSEFKDDAAEFDAGGVSNSDSAATRANVSPKRRSIEVIANLVRMFTFMK
jgi:hypothetical protein